MGATAFFLEGCGSFLIFFCPPREKAVQVKSKSNKPENSGRYFFFFHMKLFLGKKISTIKPCFSSLLVAYMGGFYEFHVLSIVKDYIIKALWEDCWRGSSLVRGRGKFFVCVSDFLCSILPSNSAASPQLVVSDVHDKFLFSLQADGSWQAGGVILWESHEIQ